MKERTFSAVVRPWDEAWQFWKRVPKSGVWQLAGEADLCDLRTSGDTLCAIPARFVIAHPFYVDASDIETAREMALLEVEMSGLAVGERLQKDVVIEVLRTEGERALALALIYPSEWPKSLSSLAGEAFEASPRLVVLEDNTVHLWREGDDLVAAVAWGAHVIYWESLPWTLDHREIGAWLSCLLHQLREELRIEASLAFKQWTPIFREIPEGFLRAQPLNDEDQRDGPVPVTRSATWAPEHWRVIRAAKRSKEALLKLAATGALLFVLAGTGAFLAFASLHAELSKADAEIRQLEVQTAPIREAAERWRQIEAAVDEKFYPIEVLRVVVGALPPKDVRLTSFEMSPEKVLIEGEAGNLGAASDYLNQLQREATELSWEMPAPSLQANNRAKFIINGERGGSSGE